MPKAYFTFAKQIFHRRRRFHSFRQERISLKKAPTKSMLFSGGGRWIRFSAEKPRRLQQSTGLLLRAAFRIPPSIEKKNRPIGQFFFSGAVGGIRTLVPLLTTTRFPVVLVMTSSIPLHIHFAAQHSNDYYTKYLPFVNG